MARAPAVPYHFHTNYNSPPATFKEVFNHHLACFGEGDLDGIVSDYAEDSIIFTPNGNMKGLDQIRGLFTAFLEEFGKEGVTSEMTCTSVEGEHAFMTWTAETPDNSCEMGTDTFVVQDGKIVGQSYAGKVTPKG